MKFLEKKFLDGKKFVKKIFKKIDGLRIFFVKKKYFIKNWTKF
jgi:hypothetical protein